MKLLETQPSTPWNPLDWKNAVKEFGFSFKKKLEHYCDHGLKIRFDFKTLNQNDEKTGTFSHPKETDMIQLSLDNSDRKLELILGPIDLTYQRVGMSYGIIKLNCEKEKKAIIEFLKIELLLEKIILSRIGEFFKGEVFDNDIFQGVSKSNTAQDS